MAEDTHAGSFLTVLKDYKNSIEANKAVLQQRVESLIEVTDQIEINAIFERASLIDSRIVSEVSGET